MSRSRLGASRVVAMLCALAVGSLAFPTRALADTTPQPNQSTSIQAAVKRVAADHHRLDLKPNRSPRQETQRQAQPESQILQSGSFFKTPVGIAVLAAFGAGVGYALYSASNDRIRSEGR